MFIEPELCTNYSTSPRSQPHLLSDLQHPPWSPVRSVLQISYQKAARGVLLNYTFAPLLCSEPSLGSPVSSRGSPSSFLGLKTSSAALSHPPGLCLCCSSCLSAFLLHPGQLLTQEASARLRHAFPEPLVKPTLPCVRFLPPSPLMGLYLMGLFGRLTEQPCSSPTGWDFRVRKAWV